MADKTENTEASLADLKADLERLREDFARLLDSAGKTAQSGASDAVGAAQAQACEAAGWAKGQCGSLREAIREQPLAACAIAAGIGALVGQILLRR